jgi:hypothetical protein
MIITLRLCNSGLHGAVSVQSLGLCAVFSAAEDQRTKEKQNVDRSRASSEKVARDEDMILSHPPEAKNDRTKQLEEVAFDPVRARGGRAGIRCGEKRYQSRDYENKVKLLKIVSILQAKSAFGICWFTMMPMILSTRQHAARLHIEETYEGGRE